MRRQGRVHRVRGKRDRVGNLRVGRLCRVHRPPEMSRRAPLHRTELLQSARHCNQGEPAGTNGQRGGLELELADGNMNVLQDGSYEC